MIVELHFSHNPHLRLLSELDHEFYIPNEQAHWNDTVAADYREYYPTEPIPENLHFDETPADPDVVVNADGPECDIKSLLVEPMANPHPTAINMYHYASTLVHAPPPTEKWVVHGKGVDTERFCDWAGDLDGPIITVCNIGRVQRWNHLHGEQLQAVRDRFGDRFRVYGKGDACDAFVPHEELPERYREAAVYLDFKTVQGSTALVEAMATGCPIVVHPSRVNDFITQHYNGLITPEMADGVQELLDNPDEARRLGANARRKAAGKYPKEEFLAIWDNTIKYAHLLRRAAASP